MISSSSTVLILATMAALALVDYIPRLLAGVKRPVKVIRDKMHVPDYCILPTVYGNPSFLKYLDNNLFFTRYSSKVIVCSTTHETEEFYKLLRKLCRENGFRYRLVDTTDKNGTPVFSAYAIYKAVFKKYRKVAKTTNTPCLLMDVDTFSHDNVHDLVSTFIEEDLDVSSLRCHVDNPQTLVEKLQQYEYKTAMDNRRIDPWMTSGAASLGKAGVFRHVFSRHSDFFAGGDSEIGKLAKVMGYKIGFIDFLFLTAAPNTWKDWFNQRVIWFSGGFRHHVVNMSAFGWQHFFVFLYNSLLVYLLLPLRWIEFISFPFVLPFLVVLSWVYTFVFMFGRGWSKELLVLPIYSFFQSMVIIPYGFVRYLKLVRQHKSLGRLNFDLSSYSFSHRVVFKYLNVLSAGVVVYAAALFTAIRVSYWMHNGVWFR